MNNSLLSGLGVLVFSIGLLSGAGLALVGARLWARRGARDRASLPEPEAQPAREGAAGDAAREPGTPDEDKRLWTALMACYERCDDVNEFARSREFVDVTALVADSETPAERVLDLLLGNDPAWSAAAAFALRDRADADDLVTPLLDRLHGEVYPWTLSFLAGSLAARPAGRALIGPLLACAHDWWTDRGLIVSSLRKFCEARLEAGEAPSYAGALAGLPPSRLEAVEAMQRALELPGLEPLIAEADAARRRIVDREHLRSIGRIWGDVPEALRPLEHAGNAGQVERVCAVLTGTPARSVVVVGERGAGKTSLVLLAAARLQARGWTVFEASSRDLMAGMSLYGELEERLKTLGEKIGAANRVLWYAPDFHRLVLAGQHQHGRTGIYDFIRADVASGRLVLIGETDPPAFERLTEDRARVRVDYEIVELPGLDEKDTLDLAQRCVERMARAAAPVDCGELRLADALNLARQYLSELSGPGNLLSLLELTGERLTLNARTGTARMSLDDLLDTLSGLSGLPHNIIDDRSPLDVAEIERYFAERVKGQPEAVRALVDRIALIKAGLTDPSRPLGVFLFVGPSGTGKTELAKTLARYLFGASERMVRIDMSELQTADSLARIVGEGDPAGATRSLTGIINSHPFSVVLLDEFEKAHRNVWDLFLQVFDDGRLTDRSGNTTDFRHCIIIATSNLGAAADGTPVGFAPATAGFSPANVERQLRLTFRPEFLNRIDRIITFRPLSRDVLREVLTRELAEALARRGFRTKDWAIEWDESAVEFLLDKGYSPELGARPLKRAVEQHLLAPLAHTIVSHRFPTGDQFVFLRGDGERLVAEFIDPDAPDEEPAADADEAVLRDGQRAASLVLTNRGHPEEVAQLRRALGALGESLESESWRAESDSLYASLNEAGFWESPDRRAVLGRIEAMDRVRSAYGSARSLLARIEGSRAAARTRYSRALVARLAEQVYLLEHAERSVRELEPQDAFVLVGSRTERPDQGKQSAAFAERLVSMYEQWSAKRAMKCRALDPAAAPAGRSGAAALAITGFGAHAILAPESGWHVLEQPDVEHLHEQVRIQVRVVAQGDEPAAGDADAWLEIETALESPGQGAHAIVRRYRERPSPLVRDTVRGWRTGKLDRVLGGDFDLFG